jgi:hypothetical protein
MHLDIAQLAAVAMSVLMLSHLVQPPLQLYQIS